MLAQLSCRGHGHGDLYAAFNAHHFEVPMVLPPCAAGHHWCRVVDTNLQPPKDFTVGGNKGVDSIYTIAPFSSILLIGKS